MALQECGQPNAKDAKVSQRTQKKIPKKKFFFGFPFAFFA